MITFTVLSCVLAVLLGWIEAKKKINRKNPLFCECRIYGKFIDNEISVDDIEFEIVECFVI